MSELIESVCKDLCSQLDFFKTDVILVVQKEFDSKLSTAYICKFLKEMEYRYTIIDERTIMVRNADCNNIAIKILTKNDNEYISGLRGYKHCIIFDELIKKEKMVS